MPTSNRLAEVDVNLDSQATQKARQFINEFAVALILQAKILAYSRRANLVSTQHIHEAVAVLGKKGRRAWRSDFAIMIGSALFGAFLQGFVTALSSGSTLWLASYTALGFVGILIVFWGLRR